MLLLHWTTCASGLPYSQCRTAHTFKLVMSGGYVLKPPHCGQVTLSLDSS